MNKQDPRPLHAINEERFNRRVHWDSVFDREKDCWIWISTVFRRRRQTAQGEKLRRYPWFWVRDPAGGNRQVYARRFAWEMRYGAIVPGLNVINLCGEDLCVNPHPSHNKASDPASWRQDKQELTHPPAEVFVSDKETRKAQKTDAEVKRVLDVTREQLAQGKATRFKDGKPIPSEEEFLKGGKG